MVGMSVGGVCGLLLSGAFCYVPVLLREEAAGLIIPPMCSTLQRSCAVQCKAPAVHLTGGAYRWSVTAGFSSEAQPTLCSAM